MKNFKKLSKCQMKKLDEKSWREYQAKANHYYGNLKNQLKFFHILDYIHPILLFFSRFNPVKIVKLNNMPKIQNKSPVIFSANHSGPKDFPVISRLVKRHFFILADYTMQNDFFVNCLNKLNGCVYVDRKSKESGINALSQCIDGVNKGYSMLLFPESTWNLLNKRPMLPRKWGDIKIAQATGRPIIPIALVYNGNTCYVKFGKVKYISACDNEIQADQHLSDEMSKLRLDIWNSVEFRKNYKDIDYNEWLKNSLKSYKYFDTEYEMSVVRQDENCLNEQLNYIVSIGESIHPIKDINKRLATSKINYRLQL